LQVVKRKIPKLSEIENDNSSIEKKSTKYLKVGNTWIYKVTYSKDILNKRFDTVYISNSYVDEQSFEVFEFRVKTIEIKDNGKIENVDRILGKARENESIIEVVEGYFLREGIKNEGEYLEVYKRGGEDCNTVYTNTKKNIPILYDFKNKKINAIQNTTEGRCNNVLEYRNNDYYANGIGFLKSESSWFLGNNLYKTYISELIYFSELQ
jgi:hypothetical protein